MSSIPTKLLICSDCSTLSKETKNHHLYQDCIIIQCNQQNCYASWLVCTKSNKRFSTRHTTRIKKHFNTIINRSHQQEVFFPISDNLPTWSDSNAESMLTSNSTSDDHTQITKFPKPNDDNQFPIIESTERNTKYSTISEYSSKKYFCDELMIPGNGLRGIVGRAFMQDNNSTKKASKKESDLHIDIAYLCNRLTEDDQYLFSSVVNRLTSTHIFESTRPPLNYSDICSFYTKSKHSILGNIPSPRAFEKENHSCVSIESIINHLLAFGVQFSLINSKQNDDNDQFASSITLTKEATDIKERITRDYPNHIKTGFPLILYVILWSDDFEPNVTRKNRNSVWLKTITICPPENLKTSSLYTFPIAMGRKGQSHDMVNEMFNMELGSIQKMSMRYSKLHNDFVPVVVEPLIVSADRPERSSLNQILGHTGNSSKRWMFSELIERAYLPSCSQCFKKRLNKLKDIPSLLHSRSICKKCCDWEMNDKKVRCFFKFPVNYPTKKHPFSPAAPLGRDIVDENKSFKKLPPVEVNYTHLVEASHFAFWNYIHGTWNKGTIRSYLRLVSINGDTIENIIKFADCNKDNLPIEHTFLNTLPIPCMWRSCFRLEQCIDTPMHLLFQGVVKTIMIEMQTFLKHSSCWTKFGKRANQTMEILCSLRCDFCKVEKFNGDSEFTTGGWIAETYLAFSRIICIILVPIIQTLPKNTLALESFEQMIHSLNAMMCRLMASSSSVHDIQDHIKIFLSCCVHFHTSFYHDPSDKNVFWKCSNFMSLLNLPKQIQQFGSLRLHWEGIHERFIQCVKPMLKNMRSSTSFLRTRMQNIHNDTVMNNILRNSDSVPCRKKYIRFKDIFVYNHMRHIQANIDDGKCFMAALFDMNKEHMMYKFCVIVCYDGEIKCIPLIFKDNEGMIFNNCWFAPIELNVNTSIVYPNMGALMHDIRDYSILSCYDTQHGSKKLYSVICKSWRTRNNHGSVTLPSLTH